MTATEYPPQLHDRVQTLKWTLDQLHASAKAKPSFSATDQALWSSQLSVTMYLDSLRHGPDPEPDRFEVHETNGVYTVTGGWGAPFQTTDAELARMVRDRWAAEFSSTQPSHSSADRSVTAPAVVSSARSSTPPPTRTPSARRERPPFFWSAFFAVFLSTQMAAGLAVTGELGGTDHDPLWVGPVCAATGMVVAYVVGVLRIFFEVPAEGRAEQQEAPTST